MQMKISAVVAIPISEKLDLEKHKRQRKTLHNDPWINLGRRYNNCKYIFTQHRSISIYKKNTNSHKRRIEQKHNNSEEFS